MSEGFSCSWFPRVGDCGGSGIGMAERRSSCRWVPIPTSHCVRAREKRDEARRLVADNIDPSAKRQADKAALGNTFEVVAREWLDLVKGSIKESTFERERSQLQRSVFPELGARLVSHLTTPEILGVLKKIEVRGISDTAHRVVVRAYAYFDTRPGQGGLIT